MNGAATPTAAVTGGNWMPSTLSEWVIVVVVCCFLYMVKKQNDGILPMLTEVVTAMKALPSAIKEAVRDGVESAERTRDRLHAREGSNAEPRA